MKYNAYPIQSLVKNTTFYRWFFVAIAFIFISSTNTNAQLRAGVGKMDITDKNSGLVNDPLFVKALVLDDGSTKMAIITLDVVALEGIGPIKEGYVAKVRSRIEKEFHIPSSNILINTSHCHGRVLSNVDELTIEAVKEANENMVSVTVGAGVGYEDRIMENRRLLMKDGSQTDMRRAYSLAPDEEIEAVGPVDPEIGILRLDKRDGQTLAVVYNFAVHPIQGVPNGGNTADIIGFASKVIEENQTGAMALFLQGCGGDINPIGYKLVNTPPNAEPLGNMLGLSVLKALKEIKSQKVQTITVINATMDVPRADFSQRIDSMQAYQLKLLKSLRGTNINLKTFIPLLIKHSYSSLFPSSYAQGYLHEKMLDREGLAKMDSVNKMDMENYKKNIYIMEEQTRINENLALLRKHQAAANGRKSQNVEMLALKIGDFVLTTFPGELTVEIGLNIKKQSSHKFTFVAGYSNGYIYYAPTAAQLRNTGGAQEDCETILAPEWQQLYETKALNMLKTL